MDGNVNDTAAVASGTTIGVVLLVLAIVYRCATCARRYRLSCVHTDGSFGCIFREANVANPTDEMVKAHLEVVNQLHDDLKRAQDALIAQKMEETQFRRDAERRMQKDLRSLRRDFQSVFARQRRKQLAINSTANESGSSSDSQTELVPPGMVITDSMQRLRMRMPFSAPAFPPQQLHNTPQSQPNTPNTGRAEPATPTHRRAHNRFSSVSTMSMLTAARQPSLFIDIEEPIMLSDIRVEPVPNIEPVISQGSDTNLSTADGSSGTAAHPQRRRQRDDAGDDADHGRYEV